VNETNPYHLRGRLPRKTYTIASTQPNRRRAPPRSRVLLPANRPIPSRTEVSSVEEKPKHEEMGASGGEPLSSLAPSKSSRWVLGENMSEFIRRRIERLKIEVEELLAAGRYQQAAKKQVDVCRLAECHSETDVPSLCRHLSTLAEIRHKLGETQAAQDLYQRALASLQCYLHGEFPELLGTSETSEDSHTETQVLASYELEVARHLNLLAMFHRHVQSDITARPLIEKAILIARNRLGVGHPDFAILLGNLAGVEHSAGNLQEAESLYRQALEILRSSLGAEHPEFAQTQRDLAKVYHDWRRPREALVLAERAQENISRALGERNPVLIESLQSLAAIHIELGDFITAQLYLEQARDLFHDCEVEHHATLSEILRELAKTHREMGDHEKAEALCLEATSLDEGKVDQVDAGAPRARRETDSF